VPYKNDIKIKIGYTHMHLLSIEWNILVGGQGCSGGYGEGGGGIATEDAILLTVTCFPLHGPVSFSSPCLEIFFSLFWSRLQIVKYKTNANEITFSYLLR
jgi:hypothetical protein